MYGFDIGLVFSSKYLENKLYFSFAKLKTYYQTRMT